MSPVTSLKIYNVYHRGTQRIWRPSIKGSLSQLQTNKTPKGVDKSRTLRLYLLVVETSVTRELGLFLCSRYGSNNPFTFNNPSRLLRSTSRNSLVVPRTSSKLADRGFFNCVTQLYGILCLNMGGYYLHQV